MKNKVTKAIKSTMSVLWWLSLVISAVLLVTILGSKLRGEVPQMFGYSVLQIISGSMEPEIPGGAYIIIRRASPDEVKIGDVISFYSDDLVISGMPNTHRVMDIVESDGRLMFVTKGDANITEDKVNADGNKLIGIYVSKLDLLNSISAFMKGKGFLVVITALQLVTVGMVVFTVIRSKEKTQEQESQDK